MIEYLKKFLGDKGVCPPQPSLKHIVLAWLGGAIAIAVLGWLASFTHAALVLGSFGASCVLVFGYPDAPFSHACRY